MNQIREHFMVEDIQNFAIEALIQSGYPKETAKVTTYALLEADKRGIFSHGLAGGLGLEEAVKRSALYATVDPQVKPSILPQKYPTIAVFDAKGASGHISSSIAVDLVKKLARNHGIAKVVVKNANHFGAAGIWSSKIAEDGDLIGTVTCTTAAIVKPMGDDSEGLDYTKGAGREARMGTNPLAISIPHKEGILTADMALTKLAVSYFLKALKTGEMIKIPEYLADENYKSILNPKELVGLKDGKPFFKGSIFPLGSTHSGYKGDILLRMIEVEHSLGGGAIEKVDADASDPNKRISLAFQAQVIDFHYTKEEARIRVRELMQDYELKYFGSASRWPGDRANEAYEYSIKEGIPYDQGQIEMLKRAALHIGLNFDERVKSVGRKPYPYAIFRK
ncbi:MAG: Ldh family oxidoreductase [Candidatus Heimdallarchaeota archaeon]|nr:MAG: Ldh family oxidoreductase [Candidatus Heimdallarchaeota archaeon]